MHIKNTKIINLWGGPSSGKSTVAMGLGYLMKVNGFNVELSSEVIKQYAIESESLGINNKHPIFTQSLYILGKQNKQLELLNKKRDYIITDCPLPIISIYKPENYLNNFDSICLEQFNKYNNINILLNRKSHEFEAAGRIHNEENSILIHNNIVNFLSSNSIAYISFDANPDTHTELFNYIKNNYG